jgi:hypothetical protein
MLARPGRGRPRRPFTFRPTLEVLEDRCLPAVPVPFVSTPIPVSATVSRNTALIVGVLAPPGSARGIEPVQALPTRGMPALSQSLALEPTVTSAPASLPTTGSPSLVQFFLSSGGGDFQEPSIETPQGGNAAAGSQPDDATWSGAALRENGGGNPGAESQPDDAVWLDYSFPELSAAYGVGHSPGSWADTPN